MNTLKTFLDAAQQISIIGIIICLILWVNPRWTSRFAQFKFRLWHSCILALLIVNSYEFAPVSYQAYYAIVSAIIASALAVFLMYATFWIAYCIKSDLYPEPNQIIRYYLSNQMPYLVGGIAIASFAIWLLGLIE